MTRAVRYDKGTGQPMTPKDSTPRTDMQTMTDVPRVASYTVTPESTVSDAARALYGVATHETRMRVHRLGFTPGHTITVRI